MGLRDTFSRIRHVNIYRILLSVLPLQSPWRAKIIPLLGSTFTELGVINRSEVTLSIRWNFNLMLKMVLVDVPGFGLGDSVPELQPQRHREAPSARNCSRSALGKPQAHGTVATQRPQEAPNARDFSHVDLRRPQNHGTTATAPSGGSNTALAAARVLSTHTRHTHTPHIHIHTYTHLTRTRTHTNTYTHLTHTHTHSLSHTHTHT